MTSLDKRRQSVTAQEKADLCERFVRAYLRFNRYFTVPNFIAHNINAVSQAEDGDRIIGTFTESDTLAIRMPYSRELVGDCCIPSHKTLIDGQEDRVDFVIAESKSGTSRAGNGPAPNKIWTKNSQEAVAYIVRYLGIFDDDAKVKDVADCLVEDYRYEDEGDNNREGVRIRLVVFAQKPNGEFMRRGVTYITFSKMAKFFVRQLGISWVKFDIASRSAHRQWDEFSKLIFQIANSDLELEERQRELLRLLHIEVKELLDEQTSQSSEEPEKSECE
jgi:hypothetical protein